jgi:hypothetical protein
MRQLRVFQSVSMAPGRRVEAHVYNLGNVGFRLGVDVIGVVREGPFRAGHVWMGDHNVWLCKPYLRKRSQEGTGGSA